MAHPAAVHQSLNAHSSVSNAEYIKVLLSLPFNLEIAARTSLHTHTRRSTLKTNTADTLTKKHGDIR